MSIERGISVTLVQSAKGIIGNGQRFRERFELLDEMVAAALQSPSPQLDNVRPKLAGVPQLVEFIGRDLKKFTEIVNAFEAMFNDLSRKFRSTKVDLDASGIGLKNQRERLQKQEDDLKSQKAKLKGDETKLAEERETLESQKQETAADKEKFESGQRENADTKAQIEKEKADIEQEKADVEQKKAQIEEESARIAAAACEIEEQQKQAETARDEMRGEREWHDRTMTAEKAALAKEKQSLACDQRALVNDRERLDVDAEAVANERAALVSWQDHIDRDGSWLAKFKIELTDMQATIVDDRNKIATEQAKLAAERKELCQNQEAIVRDRDGIKREQASIARQQDDIRNKTSRLKDADTEREKRDANFKVTLDGLNDFIHAHLASERTKQDAEVKGLQCQVDILREEKLAETNARSKLEARLEMMELITDELKSFKQQLSEGQTSQLQAEEKRGVATEKLVTLQEEILKLQRSAQVSEPAQASSEDPATTRQGSVQTPPRSSLAPKRNPGTPSPRSAKKQMVEADKAKRDWSRAAQGVINFLETYKAVPSADSQPAPILSAMMILSFSTVNATTRDFMYQFTSQAPTDEWFCLQTVLMHGHGMQITWVHKDKSCAHHGKEECFQVRRIGYMELEYRVAGEDTSPENGDKGMFAVLNMAGAEKLAHIHDEDGEEDEEEEDY